MLLIENIRAFCTNDKMVLTEHLLSRMRQRHIRLEDIKKAITNGEIIEQYPTDYPFPSCLISAENLHIVCSIGEEYLYIIIAYRPSIKLWKANGKERKEK
ncbi:hypothetical protein AGMMS50293_15010 [Spirochaetia bacterium]|nr:hypothetical protein AGMMS50293_15010 [Spirochaetia bacterium]